MEGRIMTVEITVLISAFTAVAGMILGLVSARRASRADLAKQSRETATIISEIGYVKSGIDDIKRRQEKQDDIYPFLSVQECPFAGRNVPYSACPCKWLSAEGHSPGGISLSFPILPSGH